jgi:hypothetical protein
MHYSDDYLVLKSAFSSDVKKILIEGSSVSILNCRFKSDMDSVFFLRKEDSFISENIEFSYPVFIPGEEPTKKVILLMHGLNERSWGKYLVWAFWLSQITKSYVILFPISFHINRSSASWLNPRTMEQFRSKRNKDYSEIKMSTFANIALSNRLSEVPVRFFNSGYQTLFDIVKLTKQIKSGSHSIIPEGSKIDIFAYSIGAFLSQIILMGNPENLFTESKLFMFCGGSVFSNMYGTSRLIMDSLAYERIYSFYLNEFENTVVRKRSLFSDFLRSTQTGMAFRSMIDFSKFRSFRNTVLLKLKEQIRTITLKKDTVIPFEGILNTLSPKTGKESSEVQVWDFPYYYSHEDPFPVHKGRTDPLVDRSFERLITEAGLFLA